MVRKLKIRKKGRRKGTSSKNGGRSSLSSSIPSMVTQVWQPGVHDLEKGDELEFDRSAYNCLHAFHLGWSCLSFDILRDPFGLIRTEFPHTACFIAGTQANNAYANSIAICKLYNISGKKKELAGAESKDGDSEMESESSSSEDSEEEEHGGSLKPKFQVREIAHQGSVNRLRAMSQNPNICASWSDTGHVQIWDFGTHLNALLNSKEERVTTCPSVFRQPPLMKFGGHTCEGFALDWSPLVSGRLVSGDCNSCIYLWEPACDAATWNVDASPFAGHTASVEDLQWSPTEKDVFASCSVDGTIAIWDTRLGKCPAIQLKAHNADVNVISWNRLASSMLASGSDDGTFSIRDLRMLSQNKEEEDASLVAHFTYHKQPVTSIEWSPHEASSLVVSSSDNQLTIWDLSLEKDEEEEEEFKGKMEEKVVAPSNLPPQLLFVHQGQKELKEVHWHAQIPGMIMSTALDSFNLFMPSNLHFTLPPAA